MIQTWHIDVNKPFNANCRERTPAAFYILRSIRKKQDEVFKLLTDLGADWRAGDSRYLSPALYAVGFPPNLPLMKILIEEYKLNPALAIEGGHSNLLILAAADGDMPTVRYLLETCGIDPFPGSKESLSPLVYDRRTHLNVLKYYAERYPGQIDSKMYENILMQTVISTDKETFEYLLAQTGRDLRIDRDFGEKLMERTWRESYVNTQCLFAMAEIIRPAPSFWTRIRSNSYSPLSVAVRREQFSNEELRHFLERERIPLNNLTGYDLLTKAVKDEDMEMIHYWVEEASVNVNPPVKEITPVLLLALRKENLPLAEYLWQNGADINVRDDSGRSPLMAAVSTSNHSLVEWCLDRGADTSARDLEGRTVLNHATAKGDLAVLKQLIAAGADERVACFDGETLLMRAVVYGQMPIIAYWVEERKHDVNVRDLSGETVFSYMTGLKNRLPAVDYLVRHGADVNSSEGDGTLLSNMVWHEDWEVVKYLHQTGKLKPEGMKGALNNAVRVRNFEMVQYLTDTVKCDVNSSENSLLLMAMSIPDSRYAEFLCSRGAELPFVLSDSPTLLIDALWNDLDTAVDFFLNSGVDVSASLPNGYTPLMCACQKGNLFRAEQFIQTYGVDFLKSDTFGATPLMYAAMSGNVELVKFLLEKGAVASERDFQGMNLLMFAFQGYCFELAEYLLAGQGFDLSDCDSEGKNALFYALEWGQKKMYLKVLERRPDLIHVRDFSGRTPLMAGAERLRKDGLLSLIERGATLNDVDSQGKSVLDYLKTDWTLAWHDFPGPFFGARSALRRLGAKTGAEIAAEKQPPADSRTMDTSGSK